MPFIRALRQLFQLLLPALLSVKREDPRGPVWSSWLPGHLRTGSMLTSHQVLAKFREHRRAVQRSNVRGTGLFSVFQASRGAKQVKDSALSATSHRIWGRQHHHQTAALLE